MPCVRVGRRCPSTDARRAPDVPGQRLHVGGCRDDLRARGAAALVTSTETARTRDAPVSHEYGSLAGSRSWLETLTSSPLTQT